MIKLTEIVEVDNETWQGAKSLVCVEVYLARNEPSVRGGQSLLLCCCCAAAAAAGA